MRMSGMRASLASMSTRAAKHALPPLVLRHLGVSGAPTDERSDEYRMRSESLPRLSLSGQQLQADTQAPCVRSLAQG